MTKKEKIEAIVETMENWDLRTLMGWAQDARRDMLKTATAKEVNEEYKTEVLDR